MAPQRPSIDPQRIDISLDLVGQGSLAAIEQLSQQLSNVTNYLSNIGATDAGGRARGAARIAGSRSARGVHDRGASPTASQPHLSPSINNNAGANASLPPSVVDAGPNAGFLANRVARYANNELSQRRSLGGQQHTPPGFNYSQINMGTPPGRISSSASLPGGSSGNDPLGRIALQANTQDAWSGLQEGYRLPPGGLSLSTQDKIYLASNFLGASAEKSYQKQIAGKLSSAASQAGFSSNDISQLSPDELKDFLPDIDMSDVGARRFGASSLLREAGEKIAPIQALTGGLQNLYGFGSGVQQAGVAGGYQRAGQINIPGTNIGITNPFDFLKSGSAAQEGARQRLTASRLRLMGGINGSQASEIVNSLAQSGWTGSMGQNAAFDAISPLVQQGQDPRLVTQAFDRSMRQGNSSLEDFLKTMDKMGPSAKAARQDLNEYMQGLETFSDTAKSLGATGSQGYALGRGVSDITGLAPEVTSRIFQDPVFQGMGLQQGLLPSQLGTMSTGGFVKNLYKTLDFMKAATAPFMNKPYRDPNTGVITTPGVQEQAQMISTLAPDLGSADVILNQLRNEKRNTAAGVASSWLDKYGNDTKGADSYIKKSGTSGANYSLRSQKYKAGDLIPAPVRKHVVGRAGLMDNRGQPKGAINLGNGQFAVRATSDGEGQTFVPSSAKMFNDAVYARAGAGGDWSHVSEELRLMAPGKKGSREYDNYMKKVNALSYTQGADRVKAARQLIQDQTRGINAPQGDSNTSYVKFTGLAAKFFEQDKSALKKAQAAANSGGPSIAKTATVPAASATDYAQLLGVTNG